MIIYEVNLEVDAQIYDSFRTWLDQHMTEMLTFEGFHDAQLFTRKPEEESGDKVRKLLTIHYQVTGREFLQNYLDLHAARMRNDGQRLFGSAFEASRRILYPEERPLT